MRARRMWSAAALLPASPCAAALLPLPAPSFSEGHEHIVMERKRVHIDARMVADHCIGMGGVVDLGTVCRERGDVLLQPATPLNYHSLPPHFFFHFELTSQPQDRARCGEDGDSAAVFAPARPPSWHSTRARATGFAVSQTPTATPILTPRRTQTLTRSSRSHWRPLCAFPMTLSPSCSGSSPSCPLCELRAVLRRNLGFDEE
jgi:hypothetical protein